MPPAVTDQCRVGDLCSAFPEIEQEVKAAPVQLERGVINLVLMSHVVNQTAGGKCSDP